MAKQDEHISLSPTVVKVIDQFTAALRADEEIESDAIDRLEELLRKPTVPKTDEIYAALFKLSPKS